MELKINVLDKGFVRLEAQMGGDQAVVRAARVSYGKEPGDEAKDRKLIAYMLKHQHGTPFEHAVYTFHVKLPIFVARQWIRHRMSSYNEASLRYKEAPEEFYLPALWRAQGKDNKQGSDPVGWSASYTEFWRNFLGEKCEEAMRAYRSLLEAGIAREMARMVLPVNLYTEWYWTVNSRALMHFIGLRSEDHAQWEMRQYSHTLACMFAQTMPWTWAAYRAELAVKPGYAELLAHEEAFARAVGG